MSRSLESAVRAARLYAGSTACNIKVAQKLYERFKRNCEHIAKDRNTTLENVMDQVAQEASRRGAIVPIAGKDY